MELGISRHWWRRYFCPSSVVKPVGGWPFTFLDVGNGIDFLKKIGPQYALNLTNVIGVGHSAGGHLISWAASRPKLQSSAELYIADPLRITSVVVLEGLPDLEDAIDQGLCGNAALTLMGGAPFQYPERYAEGSIHYLDPLP